MEYDKTHYQSNIVLWWPLYNYSRVLDIKLIGNLNTCLG